MARGLFLLALLVAFVCLTTVSSQYLPTCQCPEPRCPRTWSYADQTCWGSQCKAWATCGTGANQSPVDVTPPVNPPFCRDAAPDVRYTTINTTVFKTENYFTFPVNKWYGNTFAYQGSQYVLSQVIFHSPSEHLVGGRQFPLEVQLVHDSPVRGGDKLVASVFYQLVANSTNCFLENLIYDLPQFSDCSCGNGRTETYGGAGFATYNEQCDNGTSPNGPNCCRPNCRLATCGDGVKDANEACDAGSRNSNTSNAACRLNCCLPTCGDRILDDQLGEACDDGNINNLDGCSSICRRECGDGEVNYRFDLEQCDNGANNSLTADACRTNCRLPICGDGIKDSNEQCDTGAFNTSFFPITSTFVPSPFLSFLTTTQGSNFLNLGYNPSQCRPDCTTGRCGDGITDINEECDEGASNGATWCSTNCTLLCGNGRVDPGEDCDQGSSNCNGPDCACRTDCSAQRCGDGIVDVIAGEECDSGYIAYGTNTVIGGWWCDNTCKQRCGSGLNTSVPWYNNTAAFVNKECDNGCYNADRPNVCRTNCRNPYCGDGITDVTEECDTAGLRSNSLPNACRMNCTLPRCGDGVLDANETCDDGNRLAGDGCDINCRLECGNGCLDPNEQCDEGANNSNTANQCRTNCKLPFCGDGIVDLCEECDSGANNSDTTPNACRTNCRLPHCGDGIVDTQYGEKCDLAAANNDLVVNGCSSTCIPNTCRQRLVQNLRLSQAVPSNKTVYAYKGSWTQPPCTENVQWVIFPQPLTLTPFQLSHFTGAYGFNGNTRLVQNLGTRTIRKPCNNVAPVCGNGLLEAGEQCDLGFVLNSNWEANKCRSTCTLPTCGDGVTDRTEECDDGSAGSLRCAGNCKLLRRVVNPFAPLQWSYQSTCRWGLINPAYAQCNGASQSPINILTVPLNTNGTGTYVLPFNYGSVTGSKFFNTGRYLSIQVPTNAAGLTRVDFKTPSEHTVNGAHADLEVQFLHGTTTATSVLFNAVPGVVPNKFLSNVLFCLPRDSQCRCNNGVIDAGEQCDDGWWNSDSIPGRCRRNCRLPRCGDGVVDRGEQCDDGAANSDSAPNACSTACVLPFCGDGVQDNGEQCDNGVLNGATGNGCSVNCQSLCGNGLLDAGEQCDNGTANSNAAPNACRSNCQLPRCGDGIIDAGEVCDDGAANSNVSSSACRLTCSLPFCGDGVADFAYNEECDGGAGCLPNCRLSCGNGIVDGLVTIGGVQFGEQCDTGRNNSNTDGNCRTDCSRPRCGDGILDKSLGEECDNGPADIYCSATCRLLCGNGVVEGTEECDAGTLNNDLFPNSCRTNCRRANCGDGVRDAGELCDFGAQNSNLPDAPCRVGCTIPKCGDGVVDVKAGEQCDGGAGCSPTCMLLCGNGRRDAGEECDNGLDNGNLPNACRSSCRNPVCGDGVVDAGEQCDSGTLNGRTGDSCRPDCTLPVCGDGVLDAAYGEQCDQGAANGDWSSSCTTDCKDATCTSADTTAVLDLSSAFPPASPGCFATYSGSLTTPPCTEGVTWNVLTAPVPIHPKQLAWITSLLSGNSRGPQPLNNRPVRCAANLAPVCGNCKREATEECDQGDLNAFLPDRCRPGCLKPRCGDGVVDSGEECDDGADNGTTRTACSTQCKFVTTCPATCAGASCATCQTTQASCCPAATTNNSGTIINVSFARLLAGAGCTGPNCS